MSSLKVQKADGSWEFIQLIGGDSTQHVPYGVATGTANNYAVTLSPAPTVLVAGLALAVKINVDSTGASTINVNGLGVKSIKKANGVNVTNLKAGGVYTLRYDGVNFQLQGEGASGNAIASDLLLGKTASTDAGDIVGTLVLPQGSQTFTSSGTFTVPAGVNYIDVFLVGGGGGGAGGGSNASSPGGGGGGGRAFTISALPVTPGSNITVTVGAGGSGSASYPAGNGGATLFYHPSHTYQAFGGTGGGTAGVRPNDGGNGGSGGGDGTTIFYGGTDGSSSGGIGQINTTREFGYYSGTLYSGGGGGGSSGTASYGGAGGGGDGGLPNVAGKAGTANTGGGGGGGADASGGAGTNTAGGNGGSGICIVRWGY